MSNRQLAPYRDYCPCCCSYRILRRFVDGSYFCYRCTSKVTQALRRLNIDSTSHHPDLSAIDAAMDQVVATLQGTSTNEQLTRWAYQSSVKRWRLSPAKR